MPTVQARTLRRAVEIVGGPEVLAVQLDLLLADVTRWMAGTDPVPQDVFLRCVDIIDAYQLQEISGKHSIVADKAQPPK